MVSNVDLTQFDPGFASIVITRIYWSAVYKTLFARLSKLQPKPQMIREGERIILEIAHALPGMS